jgi:hypothetical protein
MRSDSTPDIPPTAGRALVVATALLLGACSGSSHIVGHVTQLQGGPLTDARITIDGVKTHEELTSDPTGRFDVPGLGSGSYTLKAEKAGYVMETRAGVTVARGAAATVDFVLHPACLEEGSYVDGGLAWAMQAAQTVVYARIIAVSAADRWIVNDQCVVGIDHTATVLSILNTGPSSGDVTRTIHIVKDGRMPFAAGDEFIAFLRWEPAIGRYRPIAGPVFMIPVRDGKVEWHRTDAPQVRDGDAIARAMAGLFAFLPSAHVVR